jgi:hypothetical protein
VHACLLGGSTRLRNFDDVDNLSGILDNLSGTAVKYLLQGRRDVVVGGHEACRTLIECMFVVLYYNLKALKLREGGALDCWRSWEGAQQSALGLLAVQIREHGRAFICDNICNMSGPRNRLSKLISITM